MYQVFYLVNAFLALGKIECQSFSSDLQLWMSLGVLIKKE